MHWKQGDREGMKLQIVKNSSLKRCYCLCCTSCFAIGLLIKTDWLCLYENDKDQSSCHKPVAI